MERNIVRAAPIALALILVAGVAARQASPAAVGFISLQAIMERTPGYDQARQTYQSEMDEFASEMERGQTGLDSMMQEYDRQQAVLSPTARTGKQQEIISERQRLAARQEELRQAADARQRELLAPLEARVQSVIDGLRAERNLAMIFDVASQYGNIVTADPNLDLTGVVLQRLGVQ